MGRRGVVIAGIVSLCVVAARPLGRVHADDDALAVAREIADRVRTFPSFRDAVARGEWRTIEPWEIRSTDACHTDLRERGIGHEGLRARSLPIPAPVRVVGPIAGVTFRKMRAHAPVIVACELATRLPAIAEVLRRHDVAEVRVMSAWRRAPRTSFHTMGLALDLASFVRDDGSVLDVARDFVAHADVRTCDAEVRDREERAIALRAIACDLAASGVLSTMITPAYSEGHRSHLHVDVRPSDARLFVR